MRKWFQKFSPEYKRREREQAAFDKFKTQSLDTIKEVRFFKRDALTTDLICCEIETPINTWFFQEETEFWESLLEYICVLDGFDKDWFSKVSQPPFESCLHVAFSKKD